MGQPYVGEIRIFAGNFPPSGWLFCEGQLLSIAEYEVLFQLIGTTYGGDGETTFALPDLRGRVPIHLGAGSGLSNRVIGETGGTESLIITTPQLPSHAHVATGTSADGDRTNPKNALPAPAEELTYALSGSFTPMASSQLGFTGGNQPHNNVQPFLCLNFIISLFGIFPSPT